MDSERALLTFFLAKLSKIDPDLIIGHDICSYILSTLVSRLEANKIQNWSKIGRLRRTLFPKKVTITYSNVSTYYLMILIFRGNL